MIRVNDASIIEAEHVVTPSRHLSRTQVHISGRRIQAVLDGDHEDAARPQYRGHLLIPGMIDLQVNGAGGADAATGTQEALETIGRTLAKHGCTAYLATLITNGHGALIQSLQRLAESTGLAFSGARPLGVHLEGPFISTVRRGAHREQHIQSPSRRAFLDFWKASAGALEMLTLAPELPGALDLIRLARDRLPIVSLGHSDADFETARAAIRAGANSATHVFNAMTPLHHRRPGLLAAVLLSDLSAGLIADGIHVHPGMIELLVRCKRPADLILVSDAISAAGRPDGRYRIGSLEVTVEDGICRESDGRLAGSTLMMDQALRNMASWMGGTLSLKQIVASATVLPARLLGLNRKGRIGRGCDADLVLLDERMQVSKTWVEGRLVYDSDSRP